jgi:hypothetical protein
MFSLQSVLNSIPAEMAILNHQGVIIACNEAWLRYRINKPKLPGFPALGALLPKINKRTIAARWLISIE